MITDLPDGWTLDRIRGLSGDSAATLLSPERLVVVELHSRGGYESLPANLIISFHDLCLVRAEDDDWYMGQLDADGSVICWASYGTDLGEAIRSL